MFLLVGRADGRLPTSLPDALSFLVRPGQTLTTRLNGPEPLLARTAGSTGPALCALGLALLAAVATLVGQRRRTGLGTFPAKGWPNPCQDARRPPERGPGAGPPPPGGLGAALLIGAVAGLYPVLRAARLSPTDALRSA